MPVNIQRGELTSHAMSSRGEPSARGVLDDPHGGMAVAGGTEGSSHALRDGRGHRSMRHVAKIYFYLNYFLKFGFLL